MGRNFKKYNKKILMIVSILFIMSIAIPVEAKNYLTNGEKAYIEQSSIIKAAAIDGAAPISFSDANGEAKGIARRVMDEISDMTGLVFEYKLYDSVEELLKSDADIIYALPPNYAPDNMVLSRPFLKSETILYINSSLDFNNLNDKIYAAVKGSALPEGIKEENSIYFNTREESLNAVEKGQADYGYGNAYSVAYYTLLHDYKNIVTIPTGKETREYCIGLLNGDEILLSIINKSISFIDDNRLQTMILEAASQTERKITFEMIMEAYGKEIFVSIFFVMAILLYSVISNMRANTKLKLQNKRYETLANISNEYLYEYNVKTRQLILSEKCFQLFGNNYNEAIRILKDTLWNYKKDGQNEILRLPLSNGETGVFKAINSDICDEHGRTGSIIGKLVDISKEVAEKEELLAKAQVDGLTGLYNALTTKELIIDRLINKDEQILDAFLLIDCDNFKDINDTFGHLIGNQILEQVGKSLKQTFRSTDIIGRVGGDEFCVYIRDIPSIDFAYEKCQQLSNTIHDNIDEVGLSFSIGIALVHEKEEYENIFNKADKALYQAKGNGRAQVVIYSE